jgi:hypothetical protein
MRVNAEGPFPDMVCGHWALPLRNRQEILRDGMGGANYKLQITGDKAYADRSPNKWLQVLNGHDANMSGIELSRKNAASL